VWKTNTNTHHWTNKILCNQSSLFTSPTCRVKSVSFVWKIVPDMQCFVYPIRQKIVLNAHMWCGKFYNLR
jgi:hypothetical protein